MTVVALGLGLVGIGARTSDAPARSSGTLSEVSASSLELTSAGTEPPFPLPDEGLGARGGHGAAGSAVIVHHDVDPGDSLLRIAAAVPVNEQDLLSLLMSCREAAALRRLRPGQHLTLRVREGRLEEISLSDSSHKPLLTFTREPHRDGYAVSSRIPAAGIAALPDVRPAPVIASDPSPASPSGVAGEAPHLVAPAPSSATPVAGREGPAEVAANPGPGPATRGTFIKVASGDSLYRIFKRDGYSLSTLAAILASGKDAVRLKRIRPGQRIELHLNDANDIEALVYHPSRLVSISFRRDGDRFSSNVKERDYQKRVVVATTTIQSSLFAAAARAGIPDAVTAQLVEIFGWDVDFALDIRRGDEFAVLYEQLLVDGHVAKTGAVLAASFVNQGRVLRAVRYEVNGRPDYFTPEGERLRRAFIRTPVRFARISSGFTTSRWHPVLHRMRAHRGVDYAAPRGTPVRVTGDGRVVFVGRKGGYGKTIIVQHGGVYTTLYAHLSSYRSGLRTGSRVRQGETIGYVGSTGLATGPHLHYEFRVRGIHRNPLTVTLPRAGNLGRDQRTRFAAVAAPLLHRLDRLVETKLAQAEGG